MVMREIIMTVRKLKEYKMAEREVTILFYLDDAVLISKNEDGLLRLLQ